MNLYILGKSVYYIFILASIIFPLQAFYKYFPKKGTSQKSLLIAYGCYAVFLFAMFFVSNYVVVSVISFIILPIWVLNNILFLEGTIGFRASLTVIFYIFALLSESFTSTGNNTAAIRDATTVQIMIAKPPERFANTGIYFRATLIAMAIHTATNTWLSSLAFGTTTAINIP